MKYLVISDIHGSQESAEIAIEKFKKLNCDKIIILGDILYHGPRNDLPSHYNPKEVIKILNAYADKIIAVRGNCDADVDQMVLKFKFSRNVSLLVANKKYFLTHGHLINAQNPKIFDEETIVIHGHTHVNKKNIVNGDIYYNLGSITMPKENSARSYGILNDEGFFVYDLDDNLIKL